MLCKADAQPLYAIKWAYKKDKKMKTKIIELKPDEIRQAAWLGENLKKYEEIKVQKEKNGSILIMKQKFIK